MQNDSSDSNTITFATPDQERAFFDDLLNNGIKPHASTLAPIISTGGIAVVVHDAAPPAVTFALSLGWDGITPVFAMSGSARQRFIETMERIGDHVTARWLRGWRHGRIFVVTGGGTLLVNHDKDGYSLEQGSIGRAMA